MQNTGTSYFAFEHSLCMGQKAPFLVNLIPPFWKKNRVFLSLSSNYRILKKELPPKRRVPSPRRNENSATRTRRIEDSHLKPYTESNWVKSAVILEIMTANILFIFLARTERTCFRPSVSTNFLMTRVPKLLQDPKREAKIVFCLWLKILLRSTQSFEVCFCTMNS